MPDKTDLKKDLKHLYNPSSKDITLVDVPPMAFLIIDGSGSPNEEGGAWQQAMEAIYAVAYTIKFAIKKSGGQDFAVMPLEGLWWTEDMADFSADNKGIWRWTALVMQPEWVTEAIAQEAVDAVRRKKNPAALDQLRFATFHEGLSAQIKYIGPFSDEAPTIARMHQWIAEQGYDFHDAGKHHEIYLSDPRRVAPEKMQTILRQPVRKAED